MLSAPAGRAKDLCFGNERSFAAAQHNKPDQDFRHPGLYSNAETLALDKFAGALLALPLAILH